MIVLVRLLSMVRMQKQWGPLHEIYDWQSESRYVSHPLPKWSAIAAWHHSRLHRALSGWSGSLCVSTGCVIRTQTSLRCGTYCRLASTVAVQSAGRHADCVPTMMQSLGGRSLQVMILLYIALAVPFRACFGVETGAIEICAKRMRKN
eukprot:SAG31_NODE_765_length_12248_cov_6.802947_17_plen_148_part_00